MKATKKATKTKPAAQKRSHVSPEDFIRTWQRAGSVRAVADTLGITKECACGRASFYRKKGIALKTMGRGGHPGLNVKALAKLAKELT